MIAIQETAISDIMPTFVNPTPWDNFNEMMGNFPSMFVQIKLDILQFAAIKKQVFQMRHLDNVQLWL